MNPPLTPGTELFADAGTPLLVIANIDGRTAVALYGDQTVLVWREDMCAL